MLFILNSTPNATFTCRFCKWRFSANWSRSIAGRTSETRSGNMRSFTVRNSFWYRCSSPLISSQILIFPLKHRYPYRISRWSTSGRIRLHVFFEMLTSLTMWHEFYKTSARIFPRKASNLTRFLYSKFKFSVEPLHKVMITDLIITMEP